MMNWYDGNGNRMSERLAEDVGMPELRNPMNSAMRSNSWIARLIKSVRG